MLLCEIIKSVKRFKSLTNSNKSTVSSVVEVDLRDSIQLGSIFVSKVSENNEMKCIFFCVLIITATWSPDLAQSAMAGLLPGHIKCGFALTLPSKE